MADGKTGEFKYALPAEGRHTKGIYGVAWEADSQHIYTASADDTIKVEMWSVCKNSTGMWSAVPAKRLFPLATASRCRSTNWDVLLRGARDR